MSPVVAISMFMAMWMIITLVLFVLIGGFALIIGICFMADYFAKISNSNTRKHVVNKDLILKNGVKDHLTDCLAIIVQEYYHEVYMSNLIPSVFEDEFFP